MNAFRSYSAYPELMKASLRIFILVFYFFLIHVCIPSVAQDLELEWVKSMQGSSVTAGVSNMAKSMVDEAGNVYTAGCFFDTLDFDPGPGVYNLSGTMFIHKIDSAGNFLWARSIMASGRINAFTLDDMNNIIVTGHYSGTVDFDPGPGVFNLTCLGAITDIFVLKFDAAGNFIWARSMGGLQEDRGTSVAADQHGNVYCCGYYSRTADLDPGPGICSVSTPNTTFFILKLNAAGNFVWGKSMDFGNYFSYSDYQIACDPAGNVYTKGRFDGTADFDPGPGVYSISTMGIYSDIFIQKLDSAGNFIWAKSIEGPRVEVCRSFAIDANSNIYTIGFFDSSVDFDPGPGVYYLDSYYTAGFIQKLDVDGNFVWAKKLCGDSASVFPADIDFDSFGDAYITGYFYDRIDFDPGPAVFYITPNDSATAVFILKLSASGDFCWAKSMGGDDYHTWTNSIAIDAINNIYTTGSFTDTVDFDFGPGVVNLYNIGSADIFIQKISQCGLLSYDLGSDTAVCEGSNFLINGAVPNGSYQWQDHSTDSVFLPLETGLYTVMTQLGNCRLSDSVVVRIDKPVVVELGNDTNLCMGQVLKLTATDSNCIYRWQDNSSDSVFEVSRNGAYRVTVSNSCGSNSDEIYVIFDDCECLYMPNSFTPNDDGLNDRFFVTSACQLSEYRMMIYNRWGELIFESDNPDISWDGRFKSEYCATGIYVFDLSYQAAFAMDPIRRTGFISLLR